MPTETDTAPAAAGNDPFADAAIPTPPPDRVEAHPLPDADDAGGGDNGGARIEPAGFAPAGNRAGSGGVLSRTGWLKDAADKIAAGEKIDGGDGDGADDGDGAAKGAQPRDRDGKFAAAVRGEKTPDAAASANDGAKDAAAAAAKDSLDAAAAKAEATGKTPDDAAMDALRDELKTAKLNGREKKRYEKWIEHMDGIKAREKEAASRAAEWQAKAEEAEKRAAAKPALTPEQEEEIKSLRDRSRRYDIATDPAFVKEYDAPVKANDKRIEDGLAAMAKAAGVADDLIQSTLADYRRRGLTFATLQAELDGFSAKGNKAEVRRIENLLVRGEELAEARTAALEKHAADLRADAAAHIEGQKAAQERAQKYGERAAAATEEAFRGGETELRKLFPALVAPDAPSDKDNPATAAAKKTARAEYDAAVKSARSEFARFAPDPNDPEKTAKLTGEFQSLVLLGLMARGHLLPRLAKTLAAKDAEIAARDSRLAEFKKAGTVHAQRLAPSDDGTAKSNDGMPQGGFGTGIIQRTLQEMQRRAGAA